MALAGTFFRLNEYDICHINDLKAGARVHHDLSDFIPGTGGLFLYVFMDPLHRPFDAFIVKGF